MIEEPNRVLCGMLKPLRAPLAGLRHDCNQCIV